MTSFDRVFPNMAHPSGVSFWWLTYVILLFSQVTSAALIYSESRWQSAVQIYNYQAYSNVRMIEYKVPSEAIKSVWFFSSMRDPYDKCEERTAVVYIQYSSYPIISPLNETFPERFNLGRTGLNVVQTKSDNSSFVYDLDSPLPGSWYAAAFLGDYVDDRITQQGIGPDCKYYLGATQYIERLDYVQDIIMNALIPLKALLRYRNLYKFHTAENTWQYTVHLHNCTYQLNPQPNSTEPNMTLDYCPLRFTTRSKALPLWDSKQSSIMNCTSSPVDECNMTVDSPSTDSWQYIMFEPLVDGNVSFSIYISSKECARFPTDTSSQGGSTKDQSVPTIALNTTSYNGSFPYLNFSSVTPQNGSLYPAMHISSLGIESLDGSTSSPELQNANGYSNLSQGTSLPIAPPVGTCVRVPEMGRYSVPNQAFQVRYNLRVGQIPFPNKVIVPYYEPIVMKFDIEEFVDIGGTLRYQLELDDQSYNASLPQIVTVQTCVQKWGIPADTQGIHCEPDNYMTINNKQHREDKLYFPYPEPGSWYVSMLTQCYRNDTGNGSLVLEACVVEDVIVNFELVIYPCVDGGCGEYGSCRQYFSGVLLYSACRCVANYRGYGCSDDSVADSDRDQLKATLLLTLSNLFFLPAIVVAVYRRFYTEAMVYFYTMFFSTFYHACDGDRKYLYCMMPYGVLAHCDFFGSIMSFWVTLMAMSKLTYKLKGFFYEVGALGLAIGVTWNRHSLYTFLVPTATGLVIMLISWSVKCHQRRSCYPSRVRWLGFIMPGILIAGAGLIMFAFFETQSNYKYIHSAWHACMALCLLFILPPRPSKKTENYKLDVLESDTMGLVTCNDVLPRPQAEPSGFDNPALTQRTADQQPAQLPPKQDHPQQNGSVPYSGVPI